MIEKEHPGNSLIKAFPQNLLVIMGYITLDIKDTVGTTRSVNPGLTGILRCENVVADSSVAGIVVGTDATPVSVNDYQLITRIVHGSGSGQLVAGYTAYPADVTISGSTASFFITRAFTNGSGGSITIREVGLYSKNASFTFALDRSLTDITIDHGETKTATYTVSFTV